MNDEQKKTLTSIESQISSARSDLETIRDELQEEYEDLDEKHQSLPIGEALSTEIAEVEDILVNIDNALTAIQGFDLLGTE